HTYRGYNYRLEGIQGAILRVKLRRLEAWTEARRANAALYIDALGKLGFRVPCEMPPAGSSGSTGSSVKTRHVYHVFTLRTPHRPALQQHLQNAGIQTGIHYPVPVHLQPAHADLGYGRGSFPQAEKAANEVISIPVHPELSPDQLREVCDAMAAFPAAN